MQSIIFFYRSSLLYITGINAKTWEEVLVLLSIRVISDTSSSWLNITKACWAFL